ncbi:hypothetical protein OROGR_002304 [Orobanche gracilis]
MWRIYAFILSEIRPAVLQLHIHLPNQHHVSFPSSRSLSDVIANPKASKTQLTEFFSLNALSPTVAEMKLLYKDFPRFFVWDATKKFWRRRLRGICIGRLVSVSPLVGERYFLRLLLNHICAPTSFEYLRTYKGILYPTFRVAALARGLLNLDTAAENSLTEASSYQMPYSLRRLFATLLVYNTPSNPRALWDAFKMLMAGDHIALRKYTEQEALFKTLQSIDSFLQSAGRTIDEFGLVDFIIGASKEQLQGQDFEQELNYPVSDFDLNSINMLNSEQRAAFKEIIQTLDGNQVGAFFVDGPAGSGKTFLYRALLAAVRSRHFIALAVASSGVAASLLPGGRTTHSRFKLPIIVEDEACTISKQSVHARVIIAAKLIIWDEASMAHRKSIEAVDALLRDLMENDLPFGGKTIVFGGDFRQTIPIIIGGGRSDAVDACLINSRLWCSIRKIHLLQNMRAKGDSNFRDFLLRVGRGTQPYIQNDNIRLPAEMCLPYRYDDNPLNELLSEIFPDFAVLLNSPVSLIERAILTPKNDCVHEINIALIDKFPGANVDYYSTDLTADPFQQAYYQDYLNSINTPGLPPHLLRLKLNCSIMLLRNINPSEGLCNGTRLICRRLDRNILGAEIASGQHAGDFVFIPRIPLEPSDKQKCHIPFKRHQFPVRLCFAMTFNKSQGQTLDKVGLYLPHPVFSHGQLYVALSRVRNANDLRILIRPPLIQTVPNNITKNIVYKEVISAALV